MYSFSRHFNLCNEQLGFEPETSRFEVCCSFTDLWPSLRAGVLKLLRTILELYFCRGHLKVCVCSSVTHPGVYTLIPMETVGGSLCFLALLVPTHLHLNVISEVSGTVPWQGPQQVSCSTCLYGARRTNRPSDSHTSVQRTHSSVLQLLPRSEARRVGTGCRSRWSPSH